MVKHLIFFGHLNGVVIGIRGLASDTLVVSDMKYTYALVSIYHENQHVKQFQNMQNNVNESNLDDCISYFANGSNNQMFYEDNYFQNINEIEAEYAGINNAYKYLCEHYDSNIAEKLIVDYVNDKSCKGILDKQRYFVNSSRFKSFRTLSSINVAFENAYENAKISRRKYYKTAYGRDEVMTYMLSDDCKDIYAKFDAELDGSKQNLMVSSIINYLHPDRVHNYKAFDDFVDLSAVTVFGKELSDNFSDDVKKVCGDDWYERRTDYLIDEDNKIRKAKHDSRLSELDVKFGNITDSQSYDDIYGF